MIPANRNDDEGNPKLQFLIYVVLQVTTKYAFDHKVSLIQSYLTEMNMFVKEREMPSLVGMFDCCLKGIQPCKWKGNGHQ
jgi:hypothetical protein